MSEELRDIRCKIPALVDCYLEAEAIARDTDKCDVLRSVLGEWAKRRHTAHMEAHKRLATEGLLGDLQGSSGRQRPVAQNQPLTWD